MKRINSVGVLFLFIVSIFSCTNNNIDEGKKDPVSIEIENNFAKFVEKRNESDPKLRVGDFDIKESYVVMSNTQSFKNFSTQVDQLLIKNRPLTKEAMLKNPQAYKTLLLSTSAMMVDNGNLYYRNPDYAQRDLADVITISNPIYAVKVDGPCENNAINNAVACGRDADEAYAAAFMAAQYWFYSGDPVGAAVTIGLAYYQHQKQMKLCANTFNREISGCK